MTLLSPGGTDAAGTREATHYVLGGAHVAPAIAEQLQAAGHRVAIVDESYEPTETPGYAGDPAAVDVLTDAGVDTASTVIVATDSDRRNLLIAQQVRARFDVTDVVAFVHHPERVPVFADAGHEPLCVTTALAKAVGEAV